MKTVYKQFVWAVLIVLIAANVFLFINGMRLANDINKYELDIAHLKKDNMLLETKSFQTASLTYAATMAAQLAFTKKTSPLYLNNKAFAKVNGQVW